MAPADENECRQMLYTASTLHAPAIVRYPRSPGPGVPLAADDDRAAGRACRDSSRGAKRTGAARIRNTSRYVAQGCRAAGRHPRQHAVREAARPGHSSLRCAPAMRRWSPSRRIHCRRRGFRGGRAAEGRRLANTAVADRDPGPLHRARLARDVSGRCGARSERIERERRALVGRAANAAAASGRPCLAQGRGLRPRVKAGSKAAGYGRISSCARGARPPERAAASRALQRAPGPQEPVRAASRTRCWDASTPITAGCVGLPRWPSAPVALPSVATSPRTSRRSS